MDDRRFDALARSMAEPRSRRGFLGAALALAVGALGSRAGAQTTCPPGQIANRKGDCRCPGATGACPDGCYDLNRNPNNCGTCGTVCPAGALCRKGECQCPGRMVFDPVLGGVDPRSTTTTTSTTTAAPTTTTTAAPTTTTTTTLTPGT